MLIPTLIPLLMKILRDLRIITRPLKSIVTLNKLVVIFAVILITLLIWLSRQTAFTASFPQGINLYYLQKSDNTAFVVADHDKPELPDGT